MPVGLLGLGWYGGRSHVSPSNSTWAVPTVGERAAATELGLNQSHGSDMSGLDSMQQGFGATLGLK